MADCPTCEYHKKRAQIWRDEAYRLAGHPLPERDPVLEEREACAKLCAEDGVQAMDFTGGTFVGGYFAKKIMDRGDI
jgi:hypothetical protein